jgi:hypothetical protein
MALPVEYLDSLPDYSPSSAVPSYAENPSATEQRLDYIPRAGRIVPTSSWSKKYKGVTVAFYAQDSSAPTPIYGHNDVIRGELSLQADGFRDVVIEVRDNLFSQPVY